MKKFHFAMLLGIFSSMALTKAVAQNHDLAVSVAKPPVETRLLDSVNSLNAKSGLAREAIMPKVLKDFKKHYQTSNESWQQISSGLAAVFTKDDAKHTIFYNQKGKWVGSIKIYQENQLPKNIRKMIKKEYHDFNILYGAELEYVYAGVNPTYVILIENDTHIKYIRISENGMDEYKSYRRTKAN